MKYYSANELKVRNKVFQWGQKTYVMGILNLTPDSFSNDGIYGNNELSLNKARKMIELGIDILDIGGESTRPGHVEISIDEELNRVIPFIELIRKESDIPISIDSSKQVVIEKALLSGADIINDVWGVRKDNPLFDLSVKYNTPIIIMHNKNNSEYYHIIPEMISSLINAICEARDKGVKANNIIIDVGIGFGKKYEHNLEVMQRLNDFNVIPYPMLLGPSRKSFIGKTLDLDVNERLDGTEAMITLGITYGSDIVRVHDIKEMMRVVKMTDKVLHYKSDN